MEELRHNEKCVNKITLIQLSILHYIQYCFECGQYNIDLIECEHDYIPVAFETANGKIQIRKYCKKCYHITSQSESHSKYNVDNLPKKNFDKYREFYDNKTHDSRSALSDLIFQLKNIQVDFLQDGYKEYLKSPHWIAKSAEIMELNHYTCQICGKPARDVHHFTYRHIGNEFNFELVSLCRSCHYGEYHPEKNIIPTNL